MSCLSQFRLLQFELHIIRTTTNARTDEQYCKLCIRLGCSHIPFTESCYDANQSLVRRILTVHLPIVYDSLKILRRQLLPIR